MKITSTILSIPPYLSTTWKNISSLHVREERGAYVLVVLLHNRVSVEVPGLDKTAIDEIFEAHARSSEEPKMAHPLESPFTFSLPFGSDSSVDTLSAARQHNPDQADLPALPPEVLKKIVLIVQALGLEDTASFPKAEPHCNCMYCQMARCIHGEEKESVEEVTAEDLSFRNWEIKQTGDQLYTVTNPLDENEHYSVFLGTPLGCTCGAKNCEHIRAVLNS